MTPNTRRQRVTLVALAVVMVPAIALTGSPAVAAGSSGQHQRNVCRLAPQYLPHTPDAVEGWLSSCSSR